MVKSSFFSKKRNDGEDQQPKRKILKTYVVTIQKIESFRGDPAKIIIGMNATVKDDEFFKFEKHETALIMDETTEKIEKYLKGPWAKGIKEF